MDFADRIDQAISWDISNYRWESFDPTEEQKEILAQFDTITDDEIKQLSTFIKWPKAGILIEYLGHEKLENHFPAFLEMMQDINWPCAGNAGRMLVKAGRKLFPEIRRVFNEVDDSTWHDWILRHLIDQWENELIAEFRPEIFGAIRRGCENSITALSMLSEREMLTKEEIKIQYEFLLEKFEGNQYMIDYLKEEIDSFL